MARIAKHRLLAAALANHMDRTPDYRYIELFDDEDMSENFPTKMTCRGRRIVLLRVYEEIPPDTHVTYWKQWRGALRRTLRRQRKALHRI